MKKLFSLALIFIVTFTYAQEKLKPEFKKHDNKTEAIYYHENGKIAQHGFFNVNNKLEGTWTSYDANGKKTAIGNYKDGVKVGKWFFWSDETLKEVDYNNNTIANVVEWKGKSIVADRN